MMPVEVVLPKVDMDMESGVIASWKVTEGAYVHRGDIVFEMETSKSMMEVEAPATGTIRGLAPITGEPVMVGTPVAWIDADDAKAQATAADTGGAARPPSPGAEGAHAPAPAAEVVDSRAIAAMRNADDDNVRASPLARRAARTRRVDLRAIKGSGPGGRIVEKDVIAHAARPGERPAAPSATSESAKGDRLVPFSPVRRIAAQRLTESARSAPHFHLTAQVDMTALIAARKRLAASTPHAAAKPSMTVLLAHIAARALTQHPMLNASVEGDAARLHAAVHIGVATEHDGDLFVPVLRDAHSRSIADLAASFARLIAAVRSRTIPPADMRGGTFTLSNLGMYGVDSFTAIINPPESAILAIGRTVDTPVGRAGEIVLRPMATLSLSSDHRIVHGVAAARFMSDLRAAIENPENLQ